MNAISVTAELTSTVKAKESIDRWINREDDQRGGSLVCNDLQRWMDGWMDGSISVDGDGDTAGGVRWRHGGDDDDDDGGHA